MKIFFQEEAVQANSTISTKVEGNPERDCNYLSTGAILLADIVPCLFVKLVAPFLPFFVK